MNLYQEQKYFKNGYHWIIGVDEAGRGSLIGPVSAAAVMINFQMFQQKYKKNNYNFQKIVHLTKDSKKLSPQKRLKIINLLKKVPQIHFAYSFVGEKIIDKINIEQASLLAMQKSIEKLINQVKIQPDLILIDGNKKIPHLSYPQKTIIKGDNKIFSIALASIIAKVKRDQKIITLAKQYPQYHFEIHKGYPTRNHLQLLKKYGPSPIHRKSYQPVKKYE